MGKRKFKKGDIIIPLPKRHKSNDMSLKNIKRLKLKRDQFRRYDWQSKDTIICVILEGCIFHYGSIRYKKGDTVEFFADAFKKITGGEDHSGMYSIY